MIGNNTPSKLLNKLGTKKNMLDNKTKPKILFFLSAFNPKIKKK